MTEPLPWVDTEDLLKSTGARNLTKSGTEWTFSCFSGTHAHGDASPSAGMNSGTTFWRCRNPACGLRGNAVDYLIALKGYNHSEAYRILSERYGGPERSVEAGALAAELERIRAAREVEDVTRIMLTEDEYLDRFALHWPPGASAQELPAPMAYMLDRGFDAETLNDWDIGFDEVSDRITIPVYGVDGALVGIKGRTWRLDNALRYLTIGDAVGRDPRYGFNTYQKAQHVFGLHRCEAVNDDLILVEGELNVIAMHQMGWRNVVAIAGSEFSERQRDLLASRARSVCLYFDGDEAGSAGADQVVEGLTPYMPVLVATGASGDAGDAIDPTTDFSREDVRMLIDGAQSSLVLRLQAS